ncbi:hypothetical protein H4684_002362, partial [Desulfomicrobium macestii]|nr:hypothetical protein [Desulfomicrobium macestii]
MQLYEADEGVSAARRLDCLKDDGHGLRGYLPLMRRHTWEDQPSIQK